MRILYRPALLLVGLLAFSAPHARAQDSPFDEPDTIPRLGIGPFLELTFRGGRGEIDGLAPQDVGLGNGPAFGGRIEYRLTPTGSIALTGSYARAEEEIGTDDVRRARDLTIVNVAGELLLKMKESVPGFFIFGGGVRFVDPDFDAGDGFLGGRGGAAFSEPIVILGAGLEFLLGRRDALRPVARFYFSVPADQPEPLDARSFATDFALGFVYLHRF